jgi:predicted transcriptional regulator
MATTLGIKVDDATRKRLTDLAGELDRTPHWILKTALGEYLDRAERHERERKEDLARWERFVLTGEAIEHDQARDWLARLSDGERRPWR